MILTSYSVCEEFSFTGQLPWVCWHCLAAVAWEDSSILGLFNVQSAWTCSLPLRKQGLWKGGDVSSCQGIHGPGATLLGAALASPLCSVSHFCQAAFVVQRMNQRISPAAPGCYKKLQCVLAAKTLLFPSVLLQLNENCPRQKLSPCVYCTRQTKAERDLGSFLNKKHRVIEAEIENRKK